MNLIAATNLIELRDTLTALRDTLSHEEYSNLDVSNLPTFGGPKHSDTATVFSWDEHSVLVCDHGKWIIEPRTDLYMNTPTGSVDTRDGWLYTDEHGVTHDPVALGQVVWVTWDSVEQWWVEVD